MPFAGAPPRRPGSEKDLQALTGLATIDRRRCLALTTRLGRPGRRDAVHGADHSVCAEARASCQPNSEGGVRAPERWSDGRWVCSAGAAPSAGLVPVTVDPILLAVTVPAVPVTAVETAADVVVTALVVSLAPDLDLSPQPDKPNRQHSPPSAIRRLTTPTLRGSERIVTTSGEAAPGAMRVMVGVAAQAPHGLSPRGPSGSAQRSNQLALKRMAVVPRLHAGLDLDHARSTA